MTDLRWRTRRRLGLARPVTVATYRSYGGPDRAFVRGRVIEDKAVSRAHPADSWWRNLVRTYRRMQSDAVPGARVVVRLYGTETEAQADADGFFHTWLVPSAPPPADRSWHEAEVELLVPDPGGVRGVAPVLVPPRGARFGVVSDVDDTVIRADVARLARMVAGVALGSAHTRTPFPGVAAFFRALHRGTGPAPNPVFYVSNGPWNLYDLFVHFLELQGIPLGPVELRDWGPPWREIRRIGRREHKTESIRRILQTFPDLPFMLIGDSGEEDPEIYRDLVHEFPHRVPAVYIRDVSPDPLRKSAIEALAGEVSAAGSSLVLAGDTLAAARHAADHGWIEPAAVDEVAADRAGHRGGGATIVEGGEERAG
ncbi:MAG TPA: phosphatase domain-containing protein [Gemmatimonadota bacterium]|nr:phosphatase domain-containing protein [Gemmatimonadota bacterium]